MTTNSRMERMMNHMTSSDFKEEDTFIKDFTELTKEPVKRIPENVFRELFLPVFAGTGDAELERKTGEFCAHWAGIVGSHSDSAEVVDVQGNKLFTVPPLIATNLLNPTEEGFKAGMYGRTLTAMTDAARVNPRMAAAEYAAAMGEKLDKVIQKTDNNPWEQVFSFYGLIPNAAVTPTADKNTDLDEDFDFS